MQTKFSPALLQDPATATSATAIRKCVHCGFCTATCPTYILLGDELDSPRGRIYLMKEMLENQSVPSLEVVKHIDRCLSCLSCTTTCPSGVDYMHLIDHARSYIERRYVRPWPDRFIRQVLAKALPYPRRFRTALFLATLARPLTSLAKILNLRRMAAMLALAPSGLSRAEPARSSPVVSPRGRVGLSSGCIEPVLRPEIGRAATRLLNRMGFDVVVSENAGCCGALVHHLGREDDGLAAARRNVDAWWAEVKGRGLESIIVTASGCGTTIKDYGFMLRNDPQYAAKAAKISGLAQDISEFIATAGLPPLARQLELTVAYHSACSLQHGQKITRIPAQLLNEAGLTVREPVEAHICCGSAGTYNILQPDIAAQLGERKVANLERLQVDVIATGNIGCATQIATRSKVPVVHTVELLDWATGGPAPASIRNLPDRTEHRSLESTRHP